VPAFDTDRAWRSLSGRIAGIETVPFTTHASRSRWRTPARWAAGLIAAAIAFALLVPVIRGSGDSDAAKVFATGSTNVSTVHLDDGSVVRLAPNTELRVDANGKREAWLKGTAFFAIAKRNGDPFVVHTSAGDARVLGTRFELSSAGSAVRLVVFEGRVALTATGSSEIVEAGQISSAEVGRAPSSPRPADVQRLATWMSDVLIFQATPLNTVATEIERQFGTRVHVTDDALASRTISAVFDHQSLESVVAAICRVADATCEIQDTAVVIRP
jgi:transmembrane sensor